MKLLGRLIFVILCSAPFLTAAADGSAQPFRRTVDTQDGLKIVCEVRGQGETTLLFLHGWCGDRDYWKHQVDVFAADYRVVALDQAGHGESGKNREEWTVARLGADVESVVRGLGLKRVILVGHSMGGSVSLVAAKKLPGTVIAVIGVETLPNAEFKMHDEITKEIQERFAADFKGSLRSMFAGLLPEKGDPDMLQWLSTKAEAQDQKATLSLMRDLTGLDTRSLLREAKVPIRCLNSAGGYPFFTPTAIDINRQYADYNAVLIEDVGHYPMLEKPVEFNRRFLEILKEFAIKK